MVDGHLFERIAAIATKLRKKTDKPFGGIQVGPFPLGTSGHSDSQLHAACCYWRLLPATPCDQRWQTAFFRI